MREIRRPKRADVVQAVASQEGRDEATANFDKSIGAPISRLSNCSFWAPWMEFREAMFCTEVPALPLAVEKVFCVGVFQTGRLSSLQDLPLQGQRTCTCWRATGGRSSWTSFSARQALSVLRGFGRVEAVGSI